MPFFFFKNVLTKFSVVFVWIIFGTNKKMPNRNVVDEDMKISCYFLSLKNFCLLACLLACLFCLWINAYTFISIYLSLCLLIIIKCFILSFFFHSFISRITEYSLAGWNINENRKKTIDTYTHIHFTIHFIIIFFGISLFIFEIFCFLFLLKNNIYIYFTHTKKTLIYSRHFFFS